MRILQILAVSSFQNIDHQFHKSFLLTADSTGLARRPNPIESEGIASFGPTAGQRLRENIHDSFPLAVAEIVESVTIRFPFQDNV